MSESLHNTLNYGELGGSVFNVNGTLNVDSQAITSGVARVVKATFDTAVAANKAIGAHGLGVYVPVGAIITEAFVEVLTTSTSATDAATLAIQVESANDIVAAIAISDASNPWDAGLHAGKQDNTVSKMVKTTAVREIKVVSAVEALTAGKFNVFLRYVL